MLVIPPSIDFEGILNFIKIFEAFSDLIPTWHKVKTSLFKLSCLINSRCDCWFRFFSGIDIDPLIEVLLNSSFSLTSINSILFNLALYRVSNSLAFIFLDFYIIFAFIVIIKVIKLREVFNCFI